MIRSVNGKGQYADALRGLLHALHKGALETGVLEGRAARISNETGEPLALQTARLLEAGNLCLKAARMMVLVRPAEAQPLILAAAKLLADVHKFHRSSVIAASVERTRGRA